MQPVFRWEQTVAGTQYLHMGHIRVGYIAPRRDGAWDVICFLAGSDKILPQRNVQNASGALVEACWTWLREAGVVA